jgi:hypothetical protein
MRPNALALQLFLSQAYEEKGIYEEAKAELEKAATLSEKASAYVAALGPVHA